MVKTQQQQQYEDDVIFYGYPKKYIQNKCSDLINTHNTINRNAINRNSNLTFLYELFEYLTTNDAKLFINDPINTNLKYSIQRKLIHFYEQTQNRCFLEYYNEIFGVFFTLSS